MGFKIHFIHVAISSLILSQHILVVAASPVSVARVANLTAPAKLAAMAAVDVFSSSDEEFLMGSEISQRILDSIYSSVTGRTGSGGKPGVACGVAGYKDCLPDANGRTPKRCFPYDRTCVYHISK